MVSLAPAPEPRRLSGMGRGKQDRVAFVLALVFVKAVMVAQTHRCDYLLLWLDCMSSKSIATRDILLPLPRRPVRRPPVASSVLL